MLALDDIVDLGNMDALIEAAQDPRQSLVDFKDHDVRLLQDALGAAGRAGQIKVPVLVHRCDRAHRDIDRQKVPVVGDKQVEDHGNIIAEPFVAQLSLIGAAMPGII